MDATQELSMPTPIASDSSDVQLALTTAQSLWSQDPREALRWLRKAAEGAADAGDVLRSVQLARTAADLRDQAGVTASLPAPAPTADGASSPVAVAPNGVGAPASAAASNGAPQEGLSGSVALGFGHNPAQTVPATPAAAAAAALQQASIAAQAVQQAQAVSGQAVQQLSAEQQAAAKVYAAQQDAAAQQAAIAAQAVAFQAHQAQQAAIAAQQAAAQQAAQAAAAAQAQNAAQLAQTTKHPAVTTQRLTQPGPAPSPTATPAPISVSTVAAPAAPALGSAPNAAPGLDAAPPSAPFFVTHRTVRVAVSPAPNGQGEFSVHPLAAGEAVPAGWKDALLVALDPAERLFPGRS